MQTTFTCNSISAFAYNMDSTANFYSRPSYVFRGAGLPIYSGSRRQRGGSIFGALKKFALPLRKSLLKKGAKQALGLVADIAGDVMRGQNLKSSLIQHGKSRAKNFGKDALAEGIQSISGMIGKGGSYALRKRKRRSKSSRRRPKKKRRTSKSLF